MKTILNIFLIISFKVWQIYAATVTIDVGSGGLSQYTMSGNVVNSVNVNVNDTVVKYFNTNNNTFNF